MMLLPEQGGDGGSKKRKSSNEEDRWDWAGKTRLVSIVTSRSRIRWACTSDSRGIRGVQLRAGTEICGQVQKQAGSGGWMQ